MRTWKSCAEEGIALYRCCQLLKAEELFVESVRRARNENAASEHLAETLNNLAIGYSARAKYQDAANALREASSLTQTGKNEAQRLQSALSMNIRTQMLLDQEHFLEAKNESILALQSLGREHAFCSGEFWFTLARAYIGLGLLDKADDALDSYLRAVPVSTTGAYQIYIDPVVGFSYFGPGWHSEDDSRSEELNTTERMVRALLLRSMIKNLLPTQSRALLQEALDQCHKLGDHYLTAQALLSSSRLAFGANDWGEAARYCRQSLAIAEGIYGPDHPVIAAYLLNSASLTLMTDGLPECIPLMERTFAIISANFGERHPKYARCQLMWCGLLPFIEADNKNLASLQEKLIREALDTFLDFFDDDHSMVLASQVQLAELLTKTDRLPEAEALLKKLLADSTALSDTNPYPVIGCLSELMKLSEILADSDRYLLWEQIHEALDRIELGSVENKGRQIDLMRHVAFIYQKTGNLTKPEKLLQRAYELSKDLDPDLYRRCKQDLVTLFLETKSFDSALELLNQEDEDATIQQRLRDNVQLAEVLRAVDRSNESEQLAIACMSQAEKLLPDCSDSFLQFIGILTDMYITQSRLDDAVRMIGILSTNKEQLGAPARDIIPLSLRVIAESFALQHDQRAEKFFLQAISAAEEIQGKAPETLDSCLVAFAEFCLGTGQVEKAQKLYIRSLELRRDVCGEDSYPCALAMFNVAELSIDLDLDKALRLSMRALEIVDREPQQNEEYLVAALRLRAVILERSQQKAEAIACLDRARQLEDRATRRKKATPELPSA